MRIDCPGCAAAYEVPASVLTSRRVMRCARCGAEFTPASRMEAGQMQDAHAQVRQAQDALPGAPALPAPMVFSPPDAATRLDERMGLSVVPQQTSPAPNRAGILAAWILSLVLLGAGAWAVVTWRSAIVRAWPPSARLYTVLGYAR